MQGSCQPGDTPALPCSLLLAGARCCGRRVAVSAVITARPYLSCGALRTPCPFLGTRPVEHVTESWAMEVPAHTALVAKPFWLVPAHGQRRTNLCPSKASSAAGTGGAGGPARPRPAAASQGTHAAEAGSVSVSSGCIRSASEGAGGIHAAAGVVARRRANSLMQSGTRGAGGSPRPRGGEQGAAGAQGSPLYLMRWPLKVM